MEVLDPGHKYSLNSLDGHLEQTLTFVKREGEAYPGNTGHYSGTTCQEVLRALVERLTYVNNQIPCKETELAISYLKQSFWLLESRAANRKGRSLSVSADEAMTLPVCSICGHIKCVESCRS